MDSPEDRTADRLMDEYLKSLGLQRKKIAKDGSCLFRAVAEQVLHCQSRHLEVRSKCVEFLRKNRRTYEAFMEGDFEEYLHKLRDPQHWVGEVEINALAIMYKRDFWIFQDPGKSAVNITDNGFRDKVQLCFLNGNHYDSVYPLSRVRSSAVCQSILYELLYEKVFGVDQSQLTVCQRPSKTSDLLIDDFMAPCPSSEESDTETNALRKENGTCAAVVKSKGRGRGRFLSERVKRSLNPTLLRNVQYDVWTRSKKAQQKMDFCIASGLQYNVGDRCQVYVDAGGKMVSATVKKLSPDNNGPVTVYSEDRGELVVPVWKLRAPSETSWSTVVREKRVSNGAGEWEHRGRGRGKASSASSSVSQSTAPPAGRGPKQHSPWPQQQQPPLEEREAPSSKSEPVSFGLTTEQRLAKEEEEKNAALVELQFPDDRSFPALGTQPGGQSDGGRRRGGDKRRSQKNRKSPVEEAAVASPSTGDRPDSSTPPLSSAPPSSVSPPVSAAPAPKPNAHSKTSQSGMVPSSASHFSFVTPVLPAASSSSSSSSLVPKAASSSPPTFIAPIAPSPAAAQSLISRTTPSPPSNAPMVTHNPPVVTEAQASTTTSNLQTPSHRDVSEPQEASTNQLPQNPVCEQVPVQDLRTVQTKAPPSVPNDQNTSQIQPTHSPPPPPPPPPASITHPPPVYPSSLPQNEPSVPAAFSNQDPPPPPAPQPQTEHLKSETHPDTAPPPAPQPAPHYLPHAIPLQQQLAHFYQDPLYPGFPQGDTGQVAPTPPMSTSQSGDDLPRDTNILRFFFNLGVKAYSLPMHAPVMYLYPLQQTHTLHPRASPSPEAPYPPFNPTPPPPQAPPTSYHPEQRPPAAYNPAHNNPEPTPASFNTFDHAHSNPQAPPTSYHPEQRPPAAYNPAHNPEPTFDQAPPTSYHHEQRPSAAYNPAHNNPEPTPSSFNTFDHAHSNPQAPPTSYSQSHPPQPPPDPSYHQAYPPAPHVRWQQPHANQPYPPNYPYGQGGYYQNHGPNQGPPEQPQPANGDTGLGLRAARLPGAAEASASANVANLNGGRVSAPPGGPGFGQSDLDSGENMMLLVDPPLDKPIVINVPKSGSGPGSPALYSPASSDSNPAPVYINHHKPSNHGSVQYLSTNHSSAPSYIPTSHGAPFHHESMPVWAGPEDDWEESEQPRVHYARGPRRGFRHRGRGQHRPRGYNNQYQRGGRGRY